MTGTPLSAAHCRPCRAGTPALSPTAADELLEQIPAWSRQDNVIVRRFEFRDYGETLTFVNATAWISQREDHHPDLEVGYNTCTVRYTTHAVGGLSENDFICAAKVDALFAL